MIRDNRLNTIASLIDKNTNTLLDIGTDHGFLIKLAFKQDKIKKAIASDINEMPLATAKANLEGLNVSFVISNGFSNIKESFDTVVIAGMGSNLIKTILEESPENLNITYILQANNKLEILRRYLNDNNYKIIDEIIIKDKSHYYVTIKAIRSKMNLSDEEIYLGPIIKNKQSSIPYYNHLLTNINNLISGGARKEVFDEKIKLLENTIKSLNEW